MRERVTIARQRQHERLAPFGVRCNAEMSSTVMRATCPLDAACESALEAIVEERRSFTARSVDRLIKVARTIADLTGRPNIDPGCLREASFFKDPDPAADHLINAAYAS
jgi:magnesium chelatase family protein